jgi:hypothetical protein
MSRHGLFVAFSKHTKFNIVLRPVLPQLTSTVIFQPERVSGAWVDHPRDDDVDFSWPHFSTFENDEDAIGAITDAFENKNPPHLILSIRNFVAVD